MATPGLAQEMATGVLTATWGDPHPDVADSSVRLFQLTTSDGKSIDLDISEDVLGAAGGFFAVNYRTVTVAFAPAASETLAPWEGRTVIALVASSGRNVVPGGLPLVGTQRWISLPCKFNDVAAEPQSQTYFNNQYGNNAGELNHFWKADSYNKINIDGSASEPWRTLPSNRMTYVPVDGGCFTTPANLNLLFDDCVATHNPSVNFAGVFGINLMFNADLDGCAWGGGRFANLDGVNKVWPVTWEPPFGYNNNSVMEHENGHAYGLPHSNNWDGDTNPYDNEWDYLSGGAYFPGANPYGNWGTGGIAYHKEQLDWLTAADITTVAATTPFTDPGVERVGDRVVQTIDLKPLGQGAGVRMISLPVAGGNKWVVEARQKVGNYESGVPSTAVIISHVQPAGRGEANYVFDSSTPPGNNNANAGTAYTAGETWMDNHANIPLRVPGYTPEGIQVEVLAALAGGGFQVRVTRPGGCTPTTLNTTFTTPQIVTACKVIAENMIMGPGGKLTANTQDFEGRNGFEVGVNAELTVNYQVVP